MGLISTAQSLLPIVLVNFRMATKYGQEILFLYFIFLLLKEIDKEEIITSLTLTGKLLMPLQKATNEIKSGQILGNFVIREVFPEGRGGMARVVRAMPQSKTEGQGEVALKISRAGVNQAQYAAAISKEVEILQMLRHEGVVRVVPVSKGRDPYKERALELEGHPWFFGMECLRGGSLHRLLKARGSLPLPDAASIAAKVGRALEFIHAQRVVHNDIKPDNILFRRPLEVGQPYEPVLIDFGIATRSKNLMIDFGSVQYMAPERIIEIRHPRPPEHQAQDDPYKADVWSLSVLFYNMLVGQEPFTGLTEKSVTTAIQRMTPKGLANFKKDLPAELDEFITEQCLAKEPRLRPSMRQFVRFVERYQQGGRVTQAPARGLGLKLPWQK